MSILKSSWSYRPLWFMMFIAVLNCLIATSCNSRQQDQSSTENDVPPTYYFETIDRSQPVQFAYLQDEDDSSDEYKEDRRFVGELLQQCDSTLIKDGLRVSIQEETIKAPDMDTFEIIIYDMWLPSDRSEFSVNSECLSEKIISLYQMPVVCRYILHDSTMSVVCKSGMVMDSLLMSVEFEEYVVVGTLKRIEGAVR